MAFVDPVAARAGDRNGSPMKYNLVSLCRWIFACALLGSGCKRSEAATEPNVVIPPAGEVWLTTEQVQTANIDIEAAAARDVDDSILTSGRVTFDDQRVGHVFSPVTGRLVRARGRWWTRPRRARPRRTRSRAHSPGSAGRGTSKAAPSRTLDPPFVESPVSGE